MSRLAILLWASEAEARKFSAEVRRQFEPTERRPSNREIAKCVERSRRRGSLSPQEVAKRIRRRRKKQERQQPRAAQPKGRRKPTRRAVGATPDVPAPSPTMAYDPRPFTDMVAKCPHGVPTTRRCAICSPEKFKRETGI